MKNYQKISNTSFEDLQYNNNLFDRAGRPKTNGKINYNVIFNDIINKLQLSSDSSLLDIGCGSSKLTQKIINYSKKNKIRLTLNDIDPVIKFLKKNNKEKNIKYVSGLFHKIKMTKKFDYIIIYSVIHYVQNPVLFLSKAFKMLKNNGRILIGDIPNINKKARFIMSKKGRIFESKYRNKKINKIPIYKDYNDFIKKNKHLRNDINDNIICKLFNVYRKKNCNFYILEQNKNLPTCFTREDILIEKLK